MGNPFPGGCDILLALRSNGATSGAGTKARHAVFHPTYTSRADSLTEGAAEQLLAHTVTGARLCEWVLVYKPLKYSDGRHSVSRAWLGLQRIICKSDCETWQCNTESVLEIGIISVEY